MLESRVKKLEGRLEQRQQMIGDLEGQMARLLDENERLRAPQQMSGSSDDLSDQATVHSQRPGGQTTSRPGSRDALRARRARPAPIAASKDRQSCIPRSLRLPLAFAR